MVLPLAGIVAAADIASGLATVIAVGIQVQDSLSPKLEEYGEQIETLEAKTTSWLDSFAHFATPAGALDALMVSADYIKNAILDAAQIQTSMIATASDLSTNLKIPIDDALKKVEDSQVAIAGLAAALPGETAGYADIFRSISGTLSKQFSGDEFKQQSEEFTKRIGILSAIRGADPSYAGGAVNRLLAGTSGVGEAVVQDIFQRNPALYSALLEQLQEQKVDPNDWKKIKQEVRTKILGNALAIAAPDSLIEAFEGTLLGTMEAVRTQIFDPISGVLGVLRRVETQGGKNVLDAVNEIFQTLNNLKDRVVEILANTGINLDPFHYLIELFSYINTTIGQLVLVGLSKDPLGAFSDWFKNLPDMLATLVGDALKFLANIFDRLMDVGIGGDDIGQIVGKLMNAFDYIKLKVLENIDIKQIVEIYYQIQKEMAMMERAIWWESIKVLPTRMANAVNEWIIGLQLGFQHVRVAWDKYVDFMVKMIQSLIDLVTFSPIKTLWEKATGADDQPKNVAVVPDNSAIATEAKQESGIRGFFNKNIAEPLSKLGIPVAKPDSEQQPAKDAKPITLPGKTENNKSIKTSFAPVININGTSGDKSEDIANMVMEQIYAAYNQFTENSLA